MDFMAQFATLIREYLQYIILGMTGLIFLALIIFININFKLAKLNRRYEKMMRGIDGANLEEMLFSHIEEVRQTVHKVDKLNKDNEQLYELTKSCVQRVGVVRFNAFEDTGSDLSFAIALLDAKDNGVLISSIFGRNDSRTYAKPVIAGQSSYFLTQEEKQALQQAREKNFKG